MSGNIALNEIEAKKELLIGLSRNIWENPEVGYQEVKASQWSAELLENEGFTVERNYVGMPTAIKAVWGSGHPVIGFLGEYDALSNMSQSVSTEYDPVVAGGPGHGCGHCLMTPACIGAALGMKKEMEERGLEGTLVVYGCPAEEMLTGKAFMARGGAFRELDIAFSWHPVQSPGSMALGALGTALNSAKFHFKGHTAHAGADPHNGRSALDAIQLMNIGAEFLREHITDDVRIHYAFTDVPGSPNVVPDKASIWYYVRANTRQAVEDTYNRLVKCAEGAAHMTETEVEIEFMGGCYETLPNKTLYMLLDKASREIPQIEWSDEDVAFAAKLNEISANYSSMAANGLVEKGQQLASGEFSMDETIRSMGGSNDVGEVEHIVPAIAFGTPSSNIGAAAHSWQITSCAGHSIGQKGMLQGARIMAVAGIRAIEDPSIIAEAKAEFEKSMAGRTYVCPIPDDVPVPGTK